MSIEINPSPMSNRVDARLSGKCALVTGAARGIGAGIARALHASGAIVYATDMTADGLEAQASAIGVDWMALDVRSESDWRRAVERIESDGRSLDILVNNAGITGFEGEAEPHDPEHASLEAWRRVHETNLDGTFLGCKYAIRSMRAHRRASSIINISSRSGLVGIPAAAAYASSKAAIRNHTKSVALYCAEQGLPIRCNSIHPGAILTPMWDAMLGEGEERERNLAMFAADTPLRRFGSVDEVASLAVYLASDESSYVTGAEFVVDGGLTAGTSAAPSRTDGG